MQAFLIKVNYILGRKVKRQKTPWLKFILKKVPTCNKRCCLQVKTPFTGKKILIKCSSRNND